MPLLEGLDGVNKMSKSLGNYVGIAEDADAQFGKLMSISDALMWRYFELLSFRPLARDRRRSKKAIDEGRNPRDVKFELARGNRRALPRSRRSNRVRKASFHRALLAEDAAHGSAAAVSLQRGCRRPQAGGRAEGKLASPPAIPRPIARSRKAPCESTATRPPTAKCAWFRGAEYVLQLGLPQFRARAGFAAGLNRGAPDTGLQNDR